MTEAAKHGIRETLHAKITVSNGSWKTRGHSSKIDILSSICAETEKVIEVMSSFCKPCEKRTN